MRSDLVVCPGSAKSLLDACVSENCDLNLSATDDDDDNDDDDGCSGWEDRVRC